MFMDGPGKLGPIHVEVSCMKKTTFTAIMAKIEVKKLASNDKGGRLTLDFNIYDDKVIADLNGLMKGDSEVAVCIAEVKGNA